MRHSVYVLDRQRGEFQEVDLETSGVVRRLPVGKDPGDLDDRTVVIGAKASCVIHERARSGETFHRTAKFHSDKRKSYFGRSVALDGSFVVAGARREAGRIIERDRDGVWKERLAVEGGKVFAEAVSASNGTFLGSYPSLAGEPGVSRGLAFWTEYAFSPASRPRFISTPPHEVTIGSPFAYGPEISGEGTIAAPALPGFLRIESIDGMPRLTRTPGIEDVGRYVIDLRLEGEHGLKDLQSFFWVDSQVCLS